MTDTTDCDQKPIVRKLAMLTIVTDLMRATELLPHADKETDRRLKWLMQDCRWLADRLERNKKEEADGPVS